MSAHVKCEVCGGRDPRKSYALDPRNLRQRFLLACASCRRQLGYREVDYTRPYAEITGREIMRGAA